MAAAHQQVTRTWWEVRRPKYETFASSLVEEESRRGDPEAARRRVETLRKLPLLEAVEKAFELAGALLEEGALPSTAQDDAMHIALAAVHGMDYLLTWNYRHIDNAEIKPLVRSVCANHGFTCPEICTPEELMGNEHEG